MGPSYHPSLFQKSDDITIISYHLSLRYKYEVITAIATSTITTSNVINIDNYENNINNNENKKYYILQNKYNRIYFIYQLSMNNLNDFIFILYSQMY